MLIKDWLLIRTKEGKLAISTLKFEIFIGKLFKKCETKHEVEWLKTKLIEVIEFVANERWNSK